MESSDIIMEHFRAVGRFYARISRASGGVEGRADVRGRAAGTVVLESVVPPFVVVPKNTLITL